MRRTLPLLWLLLGCPSDDAPDDDTDTPHTDDSDSDTDPVIDTAAPACPSFRPPAPTDATGPGLTPFRWDALLDHRARCLVVEDLDLDGRVDLALVDDTTSPARLVVRYGRPQAGQWDVETHEFTLGEGRSTDMCTAGDLDDDGDLDLLVGTNHGADAFLADGRTLTRVRDVVSLPAAIRSPRTTPSHLTWIDLDKQGPLDLVVGVNGQLADECVADDTASDTGDIQVQPGAYEPGHVLCFVGRSDGTFEPAPTGVCPDPLLLQGTPTPYGAIVADLDHDGLQDLILGNDFSTNRVFRGTPTGIEPWDDIGIDVYNHAMGMALADLDGDGQRDVYITDIGPDLVLAGAATCDTWFQTGAAWGLSGPTARTITWGLVAADLDHNGATDLLVSQSVEVDPGGFDQPLCDLEERGLDFPPVLLMLNDGSGAFTRFDVPFQPAGRGAYFKPLMMAHGDLDEDGDVDAVLTTDDTTAILWNQLPKAGSSLRVEVRDARGRPAYGARVVVRQGEGRRVYDLLPTNGLQGQSELAVHVGLADAATPVTARVRWPDSTWTTSPATLPGRVITMQQED